MKESEKEKVEGAAVAGVGAGVGGAGGATVGVLELVATQGTVTGLSAGIVIGLGAVAGAATLFLGYKAYRHFKKAKVKAGALHASEGGSSGAAIPPPARSGGEG